jgi:hypothetical protein
MAQQIDASDVSFQPKVMAAAWEACDDLPCSVAATIVNEFTDNGPVGYWEGEQSDGDVLFPDHDLMVEEKAVGVCARETAEQYAPAYVTYDSDDGKVLAVNPAQVFENHTVPSA